MFSYYVTIDTGQEGPTAEIDADMAIRRAIRAVDMPGWHLVAARDRRIVSEVRPG